MLVPPALQSDQNVPPSMDLLGRLVGLEASSIAGLPDSHDVALSYGNVIPFSTHNIALTSYDNLETPSSTAHLPSVADTSPEGFRCLACPEVFDTKAKLRYFLTFLQ